MKNSIKLFQDIIKPSRISKKPDPFPTIAPFYEINYLDEISNTGSLLVMEDDSDLIQQFYPYYEPENMLIVDQNIINECALRPLDYLRKLNVQEIVRLENEIIRLYKEINIKKVAELLKAGDFDNRIFELLRFRAKFHFWFNKHELSIPPSKLSTAQEFPFKHSADFRFITYKGVEYTFTSNQAIAIRLLYEAYLDGTPEISQHFILQELDKINNKQTSTTSLKEIFRGNLDAWNDLTSIGKRKGTRKLVI